MWAIGACVLLLALSHARAQTTATLLDPGYTIEEWGTADGLPVSAIYDLALGPQGFLWLATHNGLVRFDGVRFRVFTVETTPALPSNRIRQVWVSPDDALWIQTDGKRLVRYHNRHFTPMDSTRGLPGGYAYLLKTTVDGSAAVGSADGLRRYDPATERFVSVAPDAIRATARAVQTVSDEALWAGTTDGALVKVTRTASGAWVEAQRITDTYTEKDAVHLMARDQDGTVWAANTGTVRWIDGATLRSTTRDGHPLPDVYHPVDQPMRVRTWVGRLHPTPDGGIAVSTQLRTFHLSTEGKADIRPAPTWWEVSDPQNGTMWRSVGDVIRHGTTDVVRTGMDAAKPVAIDSIGAVWTVSNSGLLRVAPSRFRTYSVEEGLAGHSAYSIHQVRDGTLWVTARPGPGLSRITPEGRVEAVQHPSLARRIVETVLEARDGTLWMQTSRGPCTWTDATGCTPVRALNGRRGRAIYEDRDGALWVATDGMGFFRRLPAEAAGGAVPVGGSSSPAWTQFDDRHGLPDRAAVSRITETRDGALWVATRTQGIARFNGTRFETLGVADGLPIGNVREIVEANDGALWLGTEGAGLVRLTVDLHPLRIRTLHRVRQSDGLPSSSIHRILPDNRGRLWMSTNQGIFWVLESDLTAFATRADRALQVPVVQYGTRDGLRDREANGGVQGAGIRDRDGRLWFPTQDGVASIHPDDEPIRRPSPQPFIERVTSNRTVIASKPVRQLRIEPSQRTFAIQFVAPTLTLTEAVPHRYRLEGFDATWQTHKGAREARYTNVPPGRYRFRVVAERTPGMGREAALLVYVVPRMYERIEFWSLVGLLAVAFIVLSIRRRIEREERRANELEHTVAERTHDLVERTRQLATARDAAEHAREEAEKANELKSRFLAHVTHDLQTPLTGIIGFAEILQEETEGHHQRFAHLIETSARRSAETVESLLQLSRLQSDAHTLDLLVVEVRPIVDAAVRLLVPQAREASIYLNVRMPDMPVRVRGDQAALHRVITNVTGNAIKYSDPGDRVTVVLTWDDDRAVLEIDDNGPGIDPDFLPHLFEPFSRNASDSTGSGLGLAITCELVEQMNGTVAVDSTLGEGTCFRIALPLVTEPASP